MPLARVTVTGASDTTPFTALSDLSQEFPFVEWGVLWGSHFGGRFPSVGWIRHLSQAVLLYSPQQTQLALHLCGGPLTRAMQGSSELRQTFGIWRKAFQRLQANWSAKSVDYSVAVHGLLACVRATKTQDWTPQLILQAGSRLQDWPASLPPDVQVHCLYDGSGGHGKYPDAWRKPFSNVYCGWAGGLSDKNVSQALEQISKVADPQMPFWIDAESGLRTDDDSGLDLVRVRSFLKQCQKFMEAGSAVA